MPTIGSWKQYLVNTTLPYEKGNVEGDRFYLQWLSIIFKVNIQVWLALSDGIVHSCCIDSNYDLTTNIISLKTYMPHIHYQPLMRNTTSSGSTVHATQTTSNLHTHPMLFNENETRPSCDEAIQSLNKKRRITYHNLKKVIRERKKYISSIGNTTSLGSSLNATQTASNLHKGRILFNHNETHPSCHEVIQTLNKKHRLTYHNLKKIIHERKKYIGSIRNTTNLGSSLNATQTTSNLHKHRMLFNQNENHPSCHEVIQTLNKKCRLTYHNLKKVIRERNKYIATLLDRN
jgi:hypothetical protein